MANKVERVKRRNRVTMFQRLIAGVVSNGRKIEKILRGKYNVFLIHTTLLRYTIALKDEVAPDTAALSRKLNSKGIFTDRCGFERVQLLLRGWQKAFRLKLTALVYAGDSGAGKGRQLIVGAKVWIPPPPCTGERATGAGFGLRRQGKITRMSICRH